MQNHHRQRRYAVGWIRCRSLLNGSLTVGAITNSSGVAEIRTQLANYSASGAPAGKYKVTVEKYVQLPPDGVDEARLPSDQVKAYYAKRNEELEKLRVVPVRLTRSGTTPFEIILEPGGNGQWTFDLKDFPVAHPK